VWWGGGGGGGGGLGGGLCMELWLWCGVGVVGG
jgi:hypothetical protein